MPDFIERKSYHYKCIICGKYLHPLIDTGYKLEFVHCNTKWIVSMLDGLKDGYEIGKYDKGESLNLKKENKMPQFSCFFGNFSRNGR